MNHGPCVFRTYNKQLTYLLTRSSTDVPHKRSEMILIRRISTIHRGKGFVSFLDHQRLERFHPFNKEVGMWWPEWSTRLVTIAVLSWDVTCISGTGWSTRWSTLPYAVTEKGFFVASWETYYVCEHVLNDTQSVKRFGKCFELSKL